MTATARLTALMAIGASAFSVDGLIGCVGTTSDRRAGPAAGGSGGGGDSIGPASGGASGGAAGGAPGPSCTPTATGSTPTLPPSFVSNCSGCHSSYGASANPQVPDLTQYKGTADLFLAQVRQGGTLMPAFSSGAISDADVQAIFAFFKGGNSSGGTVCTPGGTGGLSIGNTDGCTGATVTFDPLFVSSAAAQPQAIAWTDAQGVLHTRGAGRVRGRHEMEDEFSIFHPQYFQDRSFVFSIDDTIPAGGKTITFTYLPEASAAANPPTNLRYWKVYGDGNVFHANVGMKPTDPKLWTWVVSRNDREGRDIQTGDLLEFEFGVFIDKTALTAQGTRTNYYSDTFRYRVGQGGGLTPYNQDTSMNDPGVNRLGPDVPGQSGGATTIPYLKLHQDLYLGQMALNIQGENIRNFLQGRRLFHTDFLTGQHTEPGNVLTAAEVADHANRAGPTYNQVTCEGCHLRDGRGVPPDAGMPMQSMVVKIGGAQVDAHGVPVADPSYGKQLQDKAVAGIPLEGSATIQWVTVSGQLKDGTVYGLQRPTIVFTGMSSGNPQYFSVRIARPVVGMGLLEAISEGEILAHADVGDCNKDGISGRPNIVWDPEDGKTHVGRFGWKASKASVRHQVAEAAVLDIGLTSSVFTTHDCGAAQDLCRAKDGPPELTDQDLDRLVTYTRLLAVPPRRDMDKPEVQRGEILFGQLGCANCHAPTQRTGNTHPFVELRDQVIHPYTDLLLHDMGVDLADSSGKELVAEPREWRTPPLWGIGLCDTVASGSGTTAFPAQAPCHFLHDGRARSLLEAVLWHGGEAQAVQERVVALPANDRAALLAFLQSL
jgi:CxxC motif-containing protein (DUF1111 family)/mono/diheme cytochrome c family protein